MKPASGHLERTVSELRYSSGHVLFSVDLHVDDLNARSEIYGFDCVCLMAQ